MKTPILNSVLLKNKMLLIAFAILSITLISCDDDDNNTTPTAVEISEDEAAEAISMAVTPDTGGMVEQSMEAIYIVEGNVDTSGKSTDSQKSYDYECGQEYTSTYIRSNDSGNFTYNVNYIWSWMLTCDEEGNPSEFNFQLDGTGSYTSPRMSSSDTNAATINITSLDEAQSVYILNQEYTREGTQESFVRNQNSFTSSINLKTSNLEVLKANHNITSGTITASFTGESSNGNTYNFSGEIVFTGNQTATLTMGSGNTYNLAW
ncbi:hypothetical protein [Lutibacter sp. B1]|uniref:hypothetical protein n=1 Tax=Lutibacter sp. B1 TaxID=2725996 RepID=UPI001457253D|nr:hypothetical protein [Lutibacter sp. B1]NLP58644.1 hypothetical protein [Lutibacter sp. B1]